LRHSGQFLIFVFTSGWLFFATPQSVYPNQDFSIRHFKKSGSVARASSLLPTRIPLATISCRAGQNAHVLKCILHETQNGTGCKMQKQPLPEYF